MGNVSNDAVNAMNANNLAESLGLKLRAYREGFVLWSEDGNTQLLGGKATVPVYDPINVIWFLNGYKAAIKTPDQPKSEEE